MLFVRLIECEEISSEDRGFVPEALLSHHRDLNEGLNMVLDIWSNFFLMWRQENTFYMFYIHRHSSRSDNFSHFINNPFVVRAAISGPYEDVPWSRYSAILVP